MPPTSLTLVADNFGSIATYSIHANPLVNPAREPSTP
jgi:hypothetical protein